MPVYGPWRTPTTTAFGDVTVSWSSFRQLGTSDATWTGARDGTAGAGGASGALEWRNSVGQPTPFQFQQSVYDLPLTPARLDPYLDPADAVTPLSPDSFWEFESPAGTVLTHPQVKLYWSLAATRGPSGGPLPNPGTEAFELYQVTSADPLASVGTWQTAAAIIGRSADLIASAVVGSGWSSAVLLPHGVVDSSDVAHVLVVAAANHAATIPASWTSDFGEALLFAGGNPLHCLVEYQGPRYRLVRNVLPPLRQHPRDDFLGGAPRQGRTSTSVQASARQGWKSTYR